MQISFSLPAGERVVLETFDSQGRSVAVLMDEIKAPGRHGLSIPHAQLGGAGNLLVKLSLGERTAAHAWVRGK